MRKIHLLNIWILILIFLWFIVSLTVGMYFTTKWNAWDIWVYLLAWLHVFFWIFWLIMKYWEFTYIPGEKKEITEEKVLFLHNENQNIEVCEKEISESSKKFFKILKYSILFLAIWYAILLIIHLLITSYITILN